jgi:hypothetical protein
MMEEKDNVHEMDIIPRVQLNVKRKSDKYKSLKRISTLNFDKIDRIKSERRR